MNKTLTINLANSIFNIDENAYQALQRYLEAVKNKLNSTGYSPENLHYIVGDVLETLKDKNNIREKVEDLKAFGYTAGGTGIKLGFKQAKKGYIQNGVNHVVIITDGAFNRNSDDYKRYVKKYVKKGIHFSVVGIKNKPNDEDEMREAAELGQGHYVPIFGLSDAQENLRQMVRLLTYKE